METQRDHQAITVEDERKSGTKSSSPDQIEKMIETPAFVNIRRRLGESEKRMKSKDNMTLSQANGSSVCIYRVPLNLKSGHVYFVEPVLVSTSPYHRVQSAPYWKFENSTKQELVNSLLHQTMEGKEVVLQHLVHAMEEFETKVRDCYSEPIEMPSDDLVEIMVFDGCFVVEFLRHVCIDENDENLRHISPILTEPRVIPELTKDLLKLENQLPFFVLEKIFDICIKKGDKTDPLRLVALKQFNLFLPISDPESLKRAVTAIDPNFKVEHLLHLFHYICTTPILNPLNYDQSSFSRWTSAAFGCLFNLFQSVNASRTIPQYEYHPLSNQSMQCATRLRSAGIKFRPRRSTNSFLQIKFHNGVLEIPPITINKVTTTALLNCIAWEQCRPDTFRCFSAYVDFMNCLIKSDKDVKFLREDGIIRCAVTYDDNKVADVFKKLGDKVVYEARDCYLSKQVNEVEAYCRSNWATLRRTYFSSPWAFISVIAATLVLVLTAIQTIMAIVAYVKPPS